MIHLDNHPHALIKEGIIFNVITFDSHDEELLENVKIHFEADEIVSCCKYGPAFIEGSWDGNLFWEKQPYPSWIKGTTKWEAPIAYPTDGKVYIWNEDKLNWEELK